MDLLTTDLRDALRANGAAAARGAPRHDPAPVLKLFLPVGAATWLATELDADGDTLFGLADLGFGCPELGYFSLREIAALRLPFGLTIERDEGFSSHEPLSVWADIARAEGSIQQPARRSAPRGRRPRHRLPPRTPRTAEGPIEVLLRWDPDARARQARN